MEYWAQAFSVWFLGFFPLAEIYVAVPAGIAMGLDLYSTVFWSVTGNYAPILLLHFGLNALMRMEGFGRWLQRIASPKAKERMDRHGFWFVLVITPWIGVWIMAATVKLLGMRERPFLIASFLSILVYAIVIGVLVDAGIEMIGRT
jgi:uncharacterized membrane protein